MKSVAATWKRRSRHFLPLKGAIGWQEISDDVRDKSMIGDDYDDLTMPTLEHEGTSRKRGSKLTIESYKYKIHIYKRKKIE